MGYRELAARLRERIARGEWPPGTRIPTEHALAAEYGTARETVSRALNMLRRAGELTSATSRGTIVTPPPVRLAVTRYTTAIGPAATGSALGPWETACARQGVDGVAELVAVGRVQADEHLADRLELPVGAELVHRSRRMLADGDVAQLQDAWMPSDVAAGTSLEREAKVAGGVYAALAAAGVELDTVTEEVTARLPTDDEQTAMGLTAAVPVVELWRTTRDATGRAIEVLRTVADSRRSLFIYDGLSIRPGS